VIANKATWSALPDSQKAAIKDCAAKAEAAGIEKSKAANAAALEALAKNNMKVLPPSEALAADLRKVGATMTEEWVAKAGEAGKAIIEAYKK
jgi:TRAP-type C4-dicarboxylate transport system substrate-binding protein